MVHLQPCIGQFTLRSVVIVEKLSKLSCRCRVLSFNFKGGPIQFKWTGQVGLMCLASDPKQPSWNLRARIFIDQSLFFFVLIPLYRRIVVFNLETKCKNVSVCVPFWHCWQDGQVHHEFTTCTHVDCGLTRRSRKCELVLFKFAPSRK